MLLNFPQALVEAKFAGRSFFQLFEDNISAMRRENTATALETVYF
jgi:hypothetical protein